MEVVGESKCTGFPITLASLERHNGDKHCISILIVGCMTIKFASYFLSLFKVPNGVATKFIELDLNLDCGLHDHKVRIILFIPF
jgi:hypothetical protein